MVKIDGWCPQHRIDGNLRLLGSIILEAMAQFGGRATPVELVSPISHLTAHYKNREHLTFTSSDVERRLLEMTKVGQVAQVRTRKPHPYGWGNTYKVLNASV